jgi:hypothetical protein
MERKVKLSLIKLREGSLILKRDFRVWINDSLLDINDLIYEFSQIQKDGFQISLGGKYGEVVTILKAIRKEKKRGLIDFVIKEDSSTARNPFIISENRVKKEQIEQIKQKLPSQPWPKGIHKVIAKELGLSNGKVNWAITYLIHQGSFKKQIEGKIIESKDETDLQIDNSNHFKK